MIKYIYPDIVSILIQLSIIIGSLYVWKRYRDITFKRVFNLSVAFSFVFHIGLFADTYIEMNDLTYVIITLSIFLSRVFIGGKIIYILIRKYKVKPNRYQ